MQQPDLMALAAEAAARAYAPYSGFAVGAALLCDNGRVYTGCNIENASYSLTVCAERVAAFRAVSDGARRFVALAVTGGPAGDTGRCTPPCGSCRQVLYEFGGPDMQILLRDGAYRLGDLLPKGFGPEALS